MTKHVRDRKNDFKVEFGSIYTPNGTMIDHMGIILNKGIGIPKFGSLVGERNIKDYYIEMTEKYRKSGFNEEADNLILLEFDRYDGILSIEEVCTFCNFLRHSICNIERVEEILSMSEEEFHNEIKELVDMGY